LRRYDDMRNKKLLKVVVMNARNQVFLLAFSVLMSGLIACSSQNPRSQPPFLFLFNERPFQMNCADRPAPFPPGTTRVVAISPVAPYARTRLDTLNLPLSEVPALTIASEPINSIQVAGSNQDHWAMQLCAEGEGNTADEATRYLQKISMERTGGLLTLNNTDSHGLSGGKGHLLVTAPAEAPVTVHSYGAVEVHDMAGPVRIAAARGRATILNTSGLVDASAMIVDFAGSQG